MVNPPVMSVLNKKITMLAPAKINLFLQVLDERDDGYHTIDSVLLPVSLSDSLDIELTDSVIETEIHTGGISNFEVEALSRLQENLVTAAIRRFKKETGYGGGAKVILEKRIPIGGGLGGGSTDAAIALIALNELADTGLDIDQLCVMGADLGCDVPALIHNRAVRVTNLGDKVELLDMGNIDSSELWAVLVNPGFGVSTGDVYDRCLPDPKLRESMVNGLLEGLRSRNIDLIAENMFNSLEQVVLSKYPLLGIIAEKLTAMGCVASLLSGSGASVFGLTRSREQADEIGSRLREAIGSFLWTESMQMMPDGVIGSTRPFDGHSLGSSPSRAAII